VAAYTAQGREGFGICIIVVVILDRWREVTCDRILLLSLRVHAAGAIT